MVPFIKTAKNPAQKEQADKNDIINNKVRNGIHYSRILGLCPSFKPFEPFKHSKRSLFVESLLCSKLRVSIRPRLLVKFISVCFSRG